MMSRLDRKISRASTHSIPGATLSECEQQKAIFPNFWVPELDDAPHVLVHGDLSSNNIIVDDRFKVQRY